MGVVHRDRRAPGAQAFAGEQSVASVVAVAGDHRHTSSVHPAEHRLGRPGDGRARSLDEHLDRFVGVGVDRRHLARGHHRPHDLPWYGDDRPDPSHEAVPIDRRSSEPSSPAPRAAWAGRRPSCSPTRAPASQFSTSTADGVAGVVDEIHGAHGAAAAIGIVCDVADADGPRRCRASERLTSSAGSTSSSTTPASRSRPRVRCPTTTSRLSWSTHARRQPAAHVRLVRRCLPHLAQERRAAHRQHRVDRGDRRHGRDQRLHRHEGWRRRADEEPRRRARQAGSDRQLHLPRPDRDGDDQPVSPLTPKPPMPAVASRSVATATPRRWPT